MQIKQLRTSFLHQLRTTYSTYSHYCLAKYGNGVAPRLTGLVLVGINKQNKNFPIINFLIFKSKTNSALVLRRVNYTIGSYGCSLLLSIFALQHLSISHVKLLIT